MENGQFNTHPQPNSTTNITSAGGYSTHINQSILFTHKEKTQKQDHEHDRDMTEIKHRHEIELIDRKAGSVGRYFGVEDNASKNITLFIIMILLVVVFILIVTFYNVSPHSEFVDKVWDTTVPLITLALGYIFGKE